MLLCNIFEINLPRSRTISAISFSSRVFPCEKTSILGGLIFHLMEYKSGKRSYTRHFVYLRGAKSSRSKSTFNGFRHAKRVLLSPRVLKITIITNYLRACAAS